MPYPEYDTLSCRNCGHELLVSPALTSETYICPECDTVVLVKVIVVDFNEPDPRHIC